MEAIDKSYEAWAKYIYTCWGQEKALVWLKENEEPLTEGKNAFN